MNEFVTIITFTFPHEVLVIRGRLESEGIRCFIPDEFTIQMHPFYSNALGGVRLQVMKSDFDEATNILKAGGYAVESKLSDLEEPKLIDQSIDFFWNKRKTRRIINFGVLGIILLVMVLSFISLAREYRDSQIMKNLTKYNWHIDRILHNGKKMNPKTNEFTGLFDSDFIRDEKLLFMNGNDILFPGFNSSTFYGKWHYESKAITISGCDTLEHIFNKIYSLQMMDEYLILISEETEIHCMKGLVR